MSTPKALEAPAVDTSAERLLALADKADWWSLNQWADAALGPNHNHLSADLAVFAKALRSLASKPAEPEDFTEALGDALLSTSGKKWVPVTATEPEGMETIGEWRLSINYGPDGEENYANVYTDKGEFVGDLQISHARAIVQAFAQPVDPKGMETTAQERRDWTTLFEAQLHDPGTVTLTRKRYEAYQDQEIRAEKAEAAVEYEKRRGDEWQAAHLDVQTKLNDANDRLREKDAVYRFSYEEGSKWRARAEKAEAETDRLLGENTQLKERADANGLASHVRQEHIYALEAELAALKQPVSEGEIDQAAEALRLAITTASNDDFSDPGSRDRSRHTDRLAAMEGGIDTIFRLEAVLRRQVRQIEDMRGALEHAAGFLKDWDGGNQATETGWCHHEILIEWQMIRDALSASREGT